MPCVAFSPDGKYVASASLDGVFAIHDVSDRFSDQHRCVYKYTPPEEVESYRNRLRVQRCWSVHWFANADISPVTENDPVWAILKRQQERMVGFEKFSGLEEWYAICAAEQGAAFWSGRHWGDGPSCASVGEVDGGLGRVAAEQGDELDLHCLYNEDVQALKVVRSAEKQSAGARESGTAESEGAWGVQGELNLHGKCTEEEPATKILRSGQDENADNGESGTLNSEGLWDADGSAESEGKGEGSEQPAEERDGDKLLLVGRESELVLYRVSEGPTGKILTELDKVCIKLRLKRHMACTDVKEIAGLGVLVVSVKGLGVLLVRLIRATGAQGGVRMLVERVFSRAGLTVSSGFSSSGDDVIGTAVVYRGEEEGYDCCAELWILWQDAMVECWELSKAFNVFDIGNAFL